MKKAGVCQFAERRLFEFTLKSVFWTKQEEKVGWEAGFEPYDPRGYDSAS